MSGDLREHLIREIAYFKWEHAGCPPGDGASFWAEAENEFESREAAAAPADEASTKSPSKASFRVVDPPPLKLKKGSSPSRKKAV